MAVEAPLENPSVVKTPVAVVFATRTQLLQAVTSLPEQLVQNGYDNSPYFGSIVFTPRRSKYVNPNLQARYTLSGSDSGTTPTVSVLIPNQAMDDNQKRQTSDSILAGEKPETAVADLSFLPEIIERFGVDFFPGLLARGYRPEHAHFSGIRTESGWIDNITLTHKGVIPSEMPTLVFRRREHADSWVERVIQKFGAVPSYDWAD